MAQRAAVLREWAATVDVVQAVAEAGQLRAEVARLRLRLTRRHGQESDSAGADEA